MVGNNWLSATVAMNRVVIHEVGPRDGLQSEKVIVPLEVRARWIEGLLGSGIDIIQLGSFVNPEKVPQMADTEALFKLFSGQRNKPVGVTFSALVLNEKGLERGLASGVDMFCMGVSASKTHSVKNTGMLPREAERVIVGMAKRAMLAGTRVQASVQSAFGCGFEGPISREAVLGIVKAYLEAGIRTISLADTAGHAQPKQVEELFGAIRELDAGVELACHFHNTYGLGLANCLAALESGVRNFESAFGGLGGCPFTKVPAGNVSTEDLVHSLQRLGMRGDIDLDSLLGVARDVGNFFGRDLPGLIMHSGSIIGFKGQSAEELAHEIA
jgi:hydroxymethylglutaryl-CoA lyase